MSRARIPVVVAAVLLPLLVLTALVLRPVPAEPTGALMVLVADPVVTSSLDEILESDGDGTITVASGSSIESARVLVEDGTIAAALTVDLEAANDVLYVAGANGSRVNEAVVAAVEELLTPLGRKVAVQDVHPADVPIATPGVLVAAGLLLGLVMMMARQWGGRLQRGSRPPRHLAERIGTDALLYGVALGLGAVVLGLPGTPPLWIALGAVLVVVAATVTATALRAIGVWGLGVAVSLFVLPVWILLRAPHPLLLPDELRSVGQWLPHGAAADVAQRMALFGDAATARPWLVLLGWAVAGALALTLTHRHPAQEQSEPAAIES